MVSPLLLPAQVRSHPSTLPCHFCLCCGCAVTRHERQKQRVPTCTKKTGLMSPWRCTEKSCKNPLLNSKRKSVQGPWVPGAPQSENAATFKWDTPHFYIATVLTLHAGSYAQYNQETCIQPKSHQQCNKY